MKATEKLEKHADILRVLARANPKMTKAIIGAADGKLINCLCECAHNVLKGNVPLGHSHLRKLKRCRADVRTLVNKRISKAKKKRILQKGGFLGALLAPVAATVLADVVKKVF